jgi:hypothetical protein
MALPCEKVVIECRLPIRLLRPSPDMPNRKARRSFGGARFHGAHPGSLADHPWPP